MRFCWIGHHFEGIPAFLSLLMNGIRFEAVFTLNTAAAARRSAGGNYPDICRQFGIDCVAVHDINHVDTVNRLRELNLDIGFVFGWSQILHPCVLETCRLGMIGAHASLLPDMRGSAPINWAIIQGRTMTGNTLMWLAPDVDSGDIIDQRHFPISRFDTCQSLYEQVAETNREMLLDLVPELLNGDRPARPQHPVALPFLKRRRPDDGLIDWHRPANAVYDFIRALTRPYPGAFTYLGRSKLMIWEAALLPDGITTGLPPGTVVGPVYSPNASACGQIVACGDGAIMILNAQPSDGTTLSGASLCARNWHGRRLAPCQEGRRHVG